MFRTLRDGGPPGLIASPTVPTMLLRRTGSPSCIRAKLTSCTLQFRMSSCQQRRSPAHRTYGYRISIIEGSLEVKLPTIWTDEKQSRAEAERRERLEERRVERERVRRKKMQMREKVGKSPTDLWLRRVEK